MGFPSLIQAFGIKLDEIHGLRIFGHFATEYSAEDLIAAIIHLDRQHRSQTKLLFDLHCQRLDDTLEFVRLSQTQLERQKDGIENKKG